MGLGRGSVAGPVGRWGLVGLLGWAARRRTAYRLPATQCEGAAKVSEAGLLVGCLSVGIWPLLLPALGMRIPHALTLQLLPLH